MKADWVVMAPGRGPFVQCERCGLYLRLDLPMPLPDVAKLMLAFVREHQGCKAQQVER